MLFLYFMISAFRQTGSFAQTVSLLIPSSFFLLLSLLCFPFVFSPITPPNIKTNHWEEEKIELAHNPISGITGEKRSQPGLENQLERFTHSLSHSHSLTLSISQRGTQFSLCRGFVTPADRDILLQNPISGPERQIICTCTTFGCSFRALNS